MLESRAIHRASTGSYHTKVKYRESLQKRILEQPRAEVLTLRADYLLAAPKPGQDQCPDCGRTWTLSPGGGVVRFKSHDKRKTNTPVTSR